MRFQALAFAPRSCFKVLDQRVLKHPFCPSSPSALMQNPGGSGGGAASEATAVEDLEKLVESLLSFARCEVENDRPNEALNAVVHAIRLSRGEEGIAAVLPLPLIY